MGNRESPDEPENAKFGNSDAPARQQSAPTTELNFTSPFGLLIAVLLSRRQPGVSVNKATARALPGRQYTSRDAGTLGVEGVKILYQTIGLFNSKAENVIKTCTVFYWTSIMAKCRRIGAAPTLRRGAIKPLTWRAKYRLRLADHRR